MTTGSDRLSPSARAAARPGAPPRTMQGPGVQAAPGADGLDAHTITLVQSSWARVAPIADAAATLFYDRLFALDPSVKALFKGDMREQKKKLMQTLSVAVDGLRNPAKLVPVLENLGVRHAGYMVKDRHYDLVAQSLLWTLREGLGDAFTPEIETAWKRVYALVAGVMRGAAAAHAESDPGEETMPNQPMGMPGSGPAPAPAARADEDEWPSIDLRSDSGRVAFAPDVRPPDARTIELVQASWARVVPIADAAATLFYDRLFALDPSVKTLFKSDMREQKKKLMQTLGVAVDGLRNPGKLVPVLQNLGVRHAAYMVQDRHYGLVGQSLIWTLREGLGDDFTPELEAAWNRVYGFVAGVMRRAAMPPRPATPAEEKATVHYAMHGAEAQPVPPRPVAPAPPPASFAPAPPAFAPAPPSFAPAPAPASAAPAPAGMVIPVSTQAGTLDVRLTFANSPAPVGAPAAAPGASMGLATAILLAATCGTLVVLAATTVLFGLRSLAGIVLMPAAATYAVPLALMVISAVVFFLGYAWGRRSVRKDPGQLR
jgi:hemoglobin-like flavoprotein